MHIGFLTDGLGHLTLGAALDKVVELGLEEVEIATGNWSGAPHVDLDLVLSDENALNEFHSLVRERGLKIGAFNASGNVLHPVVGVEHDRVVRNTMRLAEILEVDKIVMMSGLPAVFDGDRAVPWITTCWPPENVSNLELQWQQLEAYWTDLVPFAQSHGIKQIAVEMHADQLVFNAPTLKRLRAVAGEVVGANVDPSHLMWMGADPVATVSELAHAIHHVHMKDTRIEAVAATRTHLETLPFECNDQRSWNYVTLGEGNPGGAAFWQDFCKALQVAGYEGVLSIEHEDVAYPPEVGLSSAVEMVRRSLVA